MSNAKESLVKANIALDSIALSKAKTIANLTAVDASMATLVKLKKFTFWAMIISIIIVVSNILLVVIMIYIEYRDVIKIVNYYSEAVKGAPGGFATAVAIKYPVLAKLMGFQSSSYPLAVFFCMRVPEIAYVFSKDPGTFMQNMWMQAATGQGCSAVYNSSGLASPAVLICCYVMSYSNMCGGPCNAYAQDSTPTMIENGVQGALNFGMFGASVGGPWGALIGAVIGVGMSVGGAVLASKSTYSPPCVN